MSQCSALCLRVLGCEDVKFGGSHLRRFSQGDEGWTSQAPRPEPTCQLYRAHSSYTSQAAHEQGRGSTQCMPGHHSWGPTGLMWTSTETHETAIYWYDLHELNLHTVYTRSSYGAHGLQLLLGLRLSCRFGPGSGGWHGQLGQVSAVKQYGRTFGQPRPSGWY